MRVAGETQRVRQHSSQNKEVEGGLEQELANDGQIQVRKGSLADESHVGEARVISVVAGWW